MPKSPHEALHQIFREDRGLASRLFDRLSKVPPPALEDAIVLNTDLTSIKLVERRADTALMLRGSLRGEDHILLCEAQLNIDKGKLKSWPHYVSYLHDKYDCDVDLLVICQKPKTAEWARKIIKIGRNKRAPTLWLKARVLGPDNAPKITGVGEAVRDIYFATLCAITHAYSPAPEAILKALAMAFTRIDDETRDVLYHFVTSGLADSPARNVWRELMKDTDTYGYAKELADMYSPLAYEEGEAKGEARGEAKGEVKGETKALLSVLEARNIPLSDEVTEKIANCPDPDTLLTWLRRAALATNVEDVFRD
ncbi:hypothetical protein [Actinomadura gamaensis]|uniref:Transposase n=1 Tax=Actinomadura gamaensis TaxID=1763541 RepID=A0ABV9U5G5_9ACTN